MEELHLQSSLAFNSFHGSNTLLLEQQSLIDQSCLIIMKRQICDRKRFQTTRIIVSFTKSFLGTSVLLTLPLFFLGQDLTYLFDPSDDVSSYQARLSQKGDEVLFSGNVNVEANTISLVTYNPDIPSITSTQSLDITDFTGGEYEVYSWVPGIHELEYLGVLWPDDLGEPWKLARMNLNSDLVVESFVTLSLPLFYDSKQSFIADLKVSGLEEDEYVVAMTSILGSEIITVSNDWQLLHHTSLQYNPLSFFIEGRGFSLEVLNQFIYHVTEDSLTFFDASLDYVNGVDFNTEFSTGEATPISFISNASTTYEESVRIQALSAVNNIDDFFLDILVWEFDQSGSQDSMFVELPLTSEVFQFDVLTSNDSFIIGGATSKEEDIGNISLGEAVSFYIIDGGTVIWTGGLSLEGSYLGLLDLITTDEKIFALVRENYFDENISQFSNRLFILCYDIALELNVPIYEKSDAPVIFPNPVANNLNLSGRNVYPIEYEIS
jgi:hypothetical protein